MKTLGQGFITKFYTAKELLPVENAPDNSYSNSESDAVLGISSRTRPRREIGWGYSDTSASASGSLQGTEAQRFRTEDKPFRVDRPSVELPSPEALPEALRGTQNPRREYAHYIMQGKWLTLSVLATSADSLHIPTTKSTGKSL